MGDLDGMTVGGREGIEGVSGGGGGEGRGPAIETTHSEEGAKQMNERVGADIKPVDPSHPRVATYKQAYKFEFLFIHIFMVSMRSEKVFFFH